MLCFCRKVFFTDYGQIPKVERCDMDGQNRTKLVDSKIVFPHGITLDLVSRLVYWADAYLDYIEVVDYEGKNRHTILQGLLVRTAALGIQRPRFQQQKDTVSYILCPHAFVVYNTLRTVFCFINSNTLLCNLCNPVM